MLAITGLLLVSSPAAAQSNQDLPGRIVFAKDGDLWVWQHGVAEPLATGGSLTQPTWSPDGSRLAYVYRGNDFADIFVTDDQGQSEQRLTNSQSSVLENNDWNLRPTFSPDGSLIAFASDASTALPSLTLMNAADGTGRRTVVVTGLNEESVDAMAWSPDGAQLAVTLYAEPGPTQIALVPMPTGTRQSAHVLTSLTGGAVDPAWSPDGTWLAFGGRDGGAMDIYAVHPDGSGQQQLTNDGLLARAPAWSPDGAHVAYLSDQTGYFELWVVDVAADPNGALSVSNPRALTRDLHLDAASGISWGR